VTTTRNRHAARQQCRASHLHREAPLFDGREGCPPNPPPWRRGKQPKGTIHCRLVQNGRCEGGRAIEALKRIESAGSRSACLLPKSWTYRGPPLHRTAFACRRSGGASWLYGTAARAWQWFAACKKEVSDWLLRRTSPRDGCACCELLTPPAGDALSAESSTPSRCFLATFLVAL
jgi:hypothetical protein